MRETLQMPPVRAPGERFEDSNRGEQWPKKAEEIADRHLREREERARKERARFDLD